MKIDIFEGQLREKKKSRMLRFKCFLANHKPKCNVNKEVLAFSAEFPQHCVLLVPPSAISCSGNIENAWIQKYCEKLADYSFKVSWTAGKTHLAKTFSLGEEDAKLAYAFHTIAADPKLAELVQEAIDDKEYPEMIVAVLADKSNKSLPQDHPDRDYGSVGNKRSVKSGLLLMNEKMVIPFKARERILNALHIPHDGINKTRVNARQLYYWPKMNQQIKQQIESCDVSQRFDQASSIRN